jgi:hypothetical protein
VRYLLSYDDPVYGEVSSVYTEKDLREWLEDWPSFVRPTEIRIKRVV